jgi:transketolase
MLLNLDEMIRYSLLDSEMNPELAKQVEETLTGLEVEIDDMTKKWDQSDSEYEDVIKDLKEKLDALLDSDYEEKIAKLKKKTKELRGKLKTRERKIEKLENIVGVQEEFQDELAGL